MQDMDAKIQAVAAATDEGLTGISKELEKESNERKAWQAAIESKVSGLQDHK